MAFLLGTLVGLALGLVGGGGSIITVPLLVGPLGVPAHEATTMSLVIVGVTAAWASAAHAQRGNVLWSHARSRSARSAASGGWPGATSTGPCPLAFCSPASSSSWSSRR
jgi:uncharacterized membrane protein YfcA